tara:strand:- start:9473 stop:11068 length:1596 start_codon:yes stop_codon:yes gene_type:complete
MVVIDPETGEKVPSPSQPPFPEVPEEEVAEPEPERELTTEEAFKPVREIIGEQAAGVVDLGDAKFTPEKQEVQDNELLSTTTTGVTLDATGAAVPAATALTAPTVTAPTADAGIGQIDSIERNLSNMPTDVVGAEVELSPGAIINPADVVDERNKTEMIERGSLAEAKTQALAAEATVQYQIGALYESLEEGKPLPAWASKNVKKVNDIMMARGFGVSTVASAAMVSAIAESALPIAIQDANKYATIQLQNLSNEQQTALANAATIAAMDRQNLDNRMKAAVKNADTFLATDVKNADLEQQANLLNYESKKQALFTDTAAENARLNLNAKTEFEVEKFYDTLGTTVATNNANLAAAMDQFNEDQANSINKYNAKIQDAREQFNATMISAIEQSNALWRRSINTANTAEQNAANRVNAAASLGITTSALDAIWQEYRDEVSFAFTASENSLSRNQQLALTAIANQFAMEMFDAQVDADSQKSMGALVGNMMQSVFSGVINQTGIFSGDDDAGDSGFPEFPDLEDETGILFDD